MSDINESVERLTAILDRLKEMGIPPAKIEQVAALMDDYAELKERLPTQRRMQFADDARDFLIDIKAGSNRNTELLSALFRKFAEHALRHAYAITNPQGTQGRDVRGLVDQIPQMYEQEPEEIDDDEGE